MLEVQLCDKNEWYYYKDGQVDATLGEECKIALADALLADEIL